MHIFWNAFIAANDPNYFTNINNCPFGVARVRNKLFVGVPRRRPGVPATLNIINLTKVFGNKSPALEGYPNYQINDISVRLSFHI